MHPRSIVRTIALAALAASAFATQAAEVTLSGWAFGNGNLVKASGYTGADAYAGGFTASLSGSGSFDTPSFATYCVEIEEKFAFSPDAVAGYAVVDGGSYFQARRGDSSIADRLGRLMTYVFDNPAAVDTAAESTSLQLAVWNLVYDTDYKVTTVGAFRDNSAYKTQADVLLAGAQSVVTSRYDVFALARANAQDFLLLAPRELNAPTPAADVPEPGSLALCAAALAGLVGARRQRRRRSASAATTASAVNSARL